MRHFLRYALLLFLLLGGMEASAQQGKTWKEMHKVKKKETIYGIAKEYGLTEEELRKANPEMLDPNYKLKKGSYCINKGKLTKAQKKLVGKTDLAGNKRIRGKAIDIGCYEY